jgi:hypothetical protein
MDDCPFSYITKLKRNKCCCSDITYTFIKMALVSNKVFYLGGKIYRNLQNKFNG